MGDNERKERQQKIRFKEVDMRNAWDLESEVETITDTLKELNVYNTDLRFCGFDKTKLRSVKRNPGERVFCSTEEQLRLVGEDEVSNALQYGDGYVAVYDGDKLKYPEKTRANRGYVSDVEYEIKDESALLLVLKLKYK